ncbi:phosphatidylserine decarboxylase [Tieghemiomyces parasiticus]|uniref:Phosphatidylserine decarboxylase n=1 Tax=Tieghemiomyces parasiticus TaxID=78921 RepID=A0A9W8DY10_9FUNG|nr:phosphatidylserine decarboxylase [Tieghemiomyces parasiticus]
MPDSAKALTIRLQVLQARDLAPKDKNGLSDPYVIATYGKKKFSTHVVYENLNPVWNCSFDFPLSLKALVPTIVLVVWDYNRLRHTFMGELRIPLHDLFESDFSPRFFNPSRDAALWYRLSNSGRSKYASATVSGDLLLNVGLVAPPLEAQTPAWNAQLDTLAQILAAPTNVPGTSADLAAEDDYEQGDGSPHGSESDPPAPLPSQIPAAANAPGSNEPVAKMPLWDNLKAYPLHLRAQSQATPSTPTLATYLAQPLTDDGGHYSLEAELNAHNPGLPSASPLSSHDSASSPVPVPDHSPSALSTGDTLTAQEDTLTQAPSRLTLSPSQNCLAGSALSAGANPRRAAGVVLLEISSASNLPRAPNATRTGFDMDPFVVIGFARKTWRTTTKRHNLNPQWNEKLAFPVTPAELNYPLRFSLYDYDKLSNNDHIGTTELPLHRVVAYFEEHYAEILADRLLDTKLKPFFDMEELSVGLHLTKQAWRDHYNAQLHIRVSYAPYLVLRRKFWLAMCREYDSDENELLNETEVQALLDSLGSSLADDTIDGFFYHEDKNPDSDELTFDEFIDAVESYLARSPNAGSIELMAGDTHGARLGDALARSVNLEPAGTRAITPGTESPAHLPTELPASVTTDPTEGGSTSKMGRLRGSSILGAAKKSGSHLLKAAKRKVTKHSGSLSQPPSGPPTPEPVRAAALPDSGTSPAYFDTVPLPPSSAATGHVAFSLDAGSDSPSSVESPAGVEPPGPRSPGGTPPSSGESTPYPAGKIIAASLCPVCQRAPLTGLSDLDAVNHVASCYIRDSNRSSRERFVMGNFVTEAQAQRKWFTRLIKYAGYGGYAVGKNNANIIVLDRITGTQIEEKIPSYIRLGIRLMYKNIGSKSTASQRAVRNLLRSQSVKQGRKYDDPASARQIKSFIQFHHLSVDEILDPLSSFRTFNEFFYRKLKPSARPNPAPDNPRVALSPADCRMMVFPTIDEATRLWIKGRNFNLTRLLGNFAGLADRFHGGRLAICRLAPQDYHRFHIPVDGVMVDRFQLDAPAWKGSVAHTEAGADVTVDPFQPRPPPPGQADANHLTRLPVPAEAREVTFPYLVPGDYYTVNPMAIRSALDVYGENVRVLSLMDSPQFGLVAMVAVGAMMVGSVVITSEVGRTYSRMDEHGYFKFGGSTIILLFEKDRMDFDDDLLNNSQIPIETYLKMGATIGTARASATTTASTSPGTTAAPAIPT